MSELYRPVGLREMARILEADSRAFPPRRPEQPIFYPVLRREYAEQMARDWNTKDPNSGYVGFVTRFEVESDYLGRFPEQVVGAGQHRELWVPAVELPDFNRHIRGHIEILAAFYGPQFIGLVPDWLDDPARPTVEAPAPSEAFVRAHHVVIALYFAYWVNCGCDRSLLAALAEAWRRCFPDLPLFGSDNLT